MSLFTSFRYLVALHEHKHFGRAAEACHITQPALSNAIRALEDEFGAAIVKRGRSFQSFTTEGERIFESVQRVLHEQELLKQDLKSTREQPVGSLTLGAVPSVMPVAARFAGLLNKRYPGLALALRSMSSPEIDAGLENLSVDFALGYTERLKSRAVRISTIDQYCERYFLLRRVTKTTGKGLRIAKRPMTWEAAARLPLCLLTPEMHNRSIVDAAFKQAGVSVTPAIETNSILALGLSVLVGDVSSVLPGALVDVLRGYSELEAVPLSAPSVLTPIGFMFSFSDRPSQALRAALNMAADSVWQQYVAAHTGSLLSDAPGRRTSPRATLLA
jgi:DNA-binding transcriptional LysR family regulator